MSERLLESRISALRGQVRRLLVLHGFSWVIATIVPLVILAGLADWLFHLDLVVRSTLLILVVGTGLWVLAKRVLRPLLVRFADLDIALKIEDRWPGLHDRLASTIQFLRLNPSDERYGSSALREATIKQAVEETRTIDFREAIEYRPILRLGALAASAAALALLIGFTAPVSSRLALRRLFIPWGGDRWPQATHLDLQERGTTLKIARGDSFTVSVQVRNGDRIPESAYVTYAFADGEELTEPMRGTAGGEFHGRIETVNQPFKFSVHGGDDTSSIRDVPVRVVPPPALNRLTVRLVSPKYTGLPTQTLAAGLNSFRALEGTTIELDAQANKTLASAALHLGDQPAAENVAFNPARTGFKTAFPVRDNLSFWFALEDNEGFRNRDASRYDVKMFRDEPPRVVISEPRTDRDVPTDAVVPVHIELDDDFGLQSSRILYKVAAGDSEPHNPVAIPLWINPGESTASTQPVPVKHKEIDHVWKLDSLKLAVGSIITFYADARDYDSIKGPNLGKSREIRLRIVSKEDAARQFDDARRELREEIARILTMQRQAITPVDEARRTLSQTNRLPRTQRENLNNAELIQRQVGNRMSNRDEGLEQRLRHLLDDLRNFKIANPEAEQQMQQMLQRVGTVRDQHLEPAEQGLSQAGKSLAQIPEQPAGDQQGARPAPNDSTQSAQDQPAGKNQEAGKAGRAAGKNQQASAQTSQKPESTAKQASNSSKSQGDPKSGSAEAGKNQSGGDRQAASETKGAKPNQGQPSASNPEKTSSPLENARQSLAEAKTNQKAIADELRKMLDELGEFETYRGVVKDAQNLLKKQEEALKQSAEASTKPDLMGKSSESLSPEQKADLSNLASRQTDAAKGLQNLQERMNDLAKRLDESDPLAASAMREAAENSRKQGTAAKMGEAAERLEKNQMSQARSTQEQARQELRELVDSVQNRRERELSRLVKELKKAENELRELRKQQAQNLKATREAKKNPNAKERQNQLKKLAKQQAQIQQELKRQLQRLAKLNAERAGRMASDAEAKMAKAQQDMDQDQGDEAGKNEEEALSDLNDAQEELENVRREAEERLAMEQLARMGDQLKSLSQRQAKMVTDTENYEHVRKQASGKLTIAQRAGVRGLAGVQAGIKDETSGLTEQLEGAPVFSLTLKKAAENMDKAAERLQALKTDEETMKAVRAASHRFEQLIKSLENDAAKQGGGQQGGGGGGGGGAGQGGGDGIPATAQLKMLRTLQQELNERTETLDELRQRRKDLTPEQTKEAEQLATDQGALADLVRDLTRPKRDDGEE